MKCSKCHRSLIVAGHRTKEYRDDSGRVYKTRRSATYRKCPCRATPPLCPRCGKNDDTVPATNYGRPTGGWQHRCHGITTWPTP